MSLKIDQEYMESLAKKMDEIALDAREHGLDIVIMVAVEPHVPEGAYAVTCLPEGFASLNGDVGSAESLLQWLTMLNAREMRKVRAAK